jgi:hypothetical protein
LAKQLEKKQRREGENFQDGCRLVNEVTDEDILGMIILGKTPEKAA